MSALKHIVVTRGLPAAILARLRSACEGVQLTVWEAEDAMPRAALLAAVRSADALLCMLSDAVDDELLAAAAPRLRVVSTMSVGYSHIDVRACVERGIRIGYTPDVLTHTTADLALALTLATARRIPEAAAAAASGAWSTWKPMWMAGKDVHHSTVGIIGMGRIGAAAARRFKGFDCNIQYYGRSRKPEVEAELGAVHASLDDLLRTSDIVVLLCSLTPDTRGLLTYDRLAAMKPDAMLINASRGEVVDQDALVRILRERPDMLAGLDVTTPEPLPPAHPLFALPNCLILPHIGSATKACRTAMADMAVDNVLRGLEGAPLIAEVPETRHLLKQ